MLSKKQSDFIQGKIPREQFNIAQNNIKSRIKIKLKKFLNEDFDLLKNYHGKYDFKWFFKELKNKLKRCDGV